MREAKKLNPSTERLLISIENYLQSGLSDKISALTFNDRRQHGHQSYHLDLDKTREKNYADRADSYTKAALMLWDYLPVNGDTKLKEGIESLLEDVKLKNSHQLNAHISLLADLLVKACVEDKYSKSEAFRDLTQAENIQNWQRRRPPLVTISDCPNPAVPSEYYTIVQLDEPRSGWTAEQQKEFRRCSSNDEADWPDWFCTLANWEQQYWRNFLTKNPGNLDDVLDSPPCTIRRYPGLANYSWHTISIYRQNAYQQEQRLVTLTRARSSIVHPVDVKNVKEAHRLTLANITQLQADHSTDVLDDKRSMLLQSLVTPAKLAGKPIYEGPMRLAKAAAAREIGATETNYSLNQTWFHSSNRIGTGKFSMDENYSKAMCQLIGDVRRHIALCYPEVDSSVNEKLLVIENLLAKGIRQVKQANIREILPRKIISTLQTGDIDAQKLHPLFLILDSLRTYLTLHKVKSVNEEKWTNFLLAALEEITATSLVTVIAHASCKSGKDRRAMQLILEDSLMCFPVMTQESFTKKDNTETKWLAQIYQHLFTTGHHQYLASYNAAGCFGIKSVTDVLPDFILTTLAEVNGLLEHNKSSSEINRPGEVARRHYLKKYLDILHQYAEGEIHESIAIKMLRRLRIQFNPQESQSPKAKSQTAASLHSQTQAESRRELLSEIEMIDSQIFGFDAEITGETLPEQLRAVNELAIAHEAAGHTTVLLHLQQMRDRAEATIETRNKVASKLSRDRQLAVQRKVHAEGGRSTVNNRAESSSATTIKQVPRHAAIVQTLSKQFAESASSTSAREYRSAPHVKETGVELSDNSHAKMNLFMQSGDDSSDDNDKNLQAQSHDYHFKILLIGDPSVGKSVLLLRYIGSGNQHDSMTSIGLDFKIKNITLADKCIKLQIWDTAGPQHEEITQAYYRGMQGAVLVYDPSSEESFDYARASAINIAEKVPTAKVILVAHYQNDAEVVVSDAVGQQFATDNEMSFIVASARYQTNVNRVFKTLARSIYQDRIGSLQEGDTLSEAKAADNDNNSIAQAKKGSKLTSFWRKLRPGKKQNDLVPTIHKPMMVVMGASSAVGVTSIVTRYVKDSFDIYQPPTTGASYMTAKRVIAGETIRLTLWDTAGNDRVSSIHQIYAKRAEVNIWVIDKTEDLAEQLTRIKDRFKIVCASDGYNEGSRVHQHILVANKLDLAKETSPNAYKAAAALADELGMRAYLECSSKTGEGVADVFEYASLIYLQEQSAHHSIEIDFEAELLKRTQFTLSHNNEDDNSTEEPQSDTAPSLVRNN